MIRAVAVSNSTPITIGAKFQFPDLSGYSGYANYDAIGMIS
jgi:hypothetical protein